MPSSINGIGTTFCGYVAPIRWAKSGVMSQQEDHDAVVCVVVCFLPLIPMNAVHTFEWSGQQCRSIALKRTGALLAAAMLRPWLMGLFVAASFAILFSGLALLDLQQGKSRPTSPTAAILVFGLSVAAFAGAVVGWRWLKALHRRTRDIRLVTGPHPLGSSDPATWAPDVLEAVLQDAPARDPRELITVGQQALVSGNAPLAMWHARLASALGDAGGETLTDDILRNSEVVRKLEAFRKKPWLRGEHFPPAG